MDHRQHALMYALIECSSADREELQATLILYCCEFFQGYHISKRHTVLVFRFVIISNRSNGFFRWNFFTSKFWWLNQPMQKECPYTEMLSAGNMWIRNTFSYVFELNVKGKHTFGGIFEGIYAVYINQLIVRIECL